LASAQAALRQSQAQARAGAGVFWPSAGASFDAARQRTTPLRLGEPGGSATYSLYTLTGAVSYAIDLFGGERRSVEALRANVDRQRYAEGAAYLLLTGSIVDAAIAEAGYAQEADILDQIVERETAQRAILEAEYRAGHGAWAAVLAVDLQLQADRATAAGVRQRLAASTTLLKTLLGRESAGALPDLPGLEALTTPTVVPVALPSALVRQRPDILQAEASLHIASAQVGVATAALFPSISITGEGGALNTQLGRLGAPVGQFWSIEPSVNLPLFQGGALWFSRRAAEAAYVEAKADYRQTVLAALEQVADSIAALDTDAAVFAANQAAARAATAIAGLGQVNATAGVAADVDTLTLQVQADRARLSLAGSKAQQLQDAAALYVASGGGWAP
jgi:NodT family efflux transporter outer membrane factor (OMF) lipoprotein